MDQLEDLMCRIDKHLAETKASEASLSLKLFGNGIRIRQIRNGSTPTYKILRRAAEELSRLEASAGH